MDNFKLGARMRFIFICFLFFFSHISFAHTLYSRMSECIPDLQRKGAEFSATVNYKKNSSEEEQLELVRKKLFARIQKNLPKYPNGLIEQTVIFKKNIQHQQITGIVALKQIKSCNGKTYKITQNNLKLLSVIIAKNQFPTIKLKTEHKLPTHQPKKLTPIQAQGHISTQSIFGISIGDSYETAVNKLGRFTLVWPVSDSLKLTLIGRNHMFLFENNKLKRYQYHSQLLPTSLANQLELTATNNSIKLQSSEINLKDLLSNEQKHELTKTFSSVVFQQMRVDGQRTAERIKSLSVGEPIAIDNYAQLPCFDGTNSFNQFISTNINALIYFIDVDNSPALLSGCLQKFVLSTDNKLKHIELLDVISASQTENNVINTLVSAFKPWSFGKVKHGQKVTSLVSLGAKIEWRQAMLETPNWQGTFEIYDEAIFSGKVIPFTTSD